MLKKKFALDSGIEQYCGSYCEVVNAVAFYALKEMVSDGEASFRKHLKLHSTRSDFYQCFAELAKDRSIFNLAYERIRYPLI